MTRQGEYTKIHEVDSTFDMEMGGAFFYWSRQGVNADFRRATQVAKGTSSNH